MQALTTILRRTAVIAMLAVLAPAFSPRAAAAAKAPVWEVVEAVDADAASVQVASEAANPRFDVAVRDSFIYITVDHPIKIEVFTILGQLVTSKTVVPGTVRLSLGNRGIYIIKGAGSTRRVNL